MMTNTTSTSVKEKAFSLRLNLKVDRFRIGFSVDFNTAASKYSLSKGYFLDAASFIPC
jgi:hypothetical protein